VEHEERSDKLEQQGDRMEDRADEVAEQIEDTRREWEAKQQDPAVPGAQPDPGEAEEPVAGVQADEDTVSEEGGP